MRAMASVLQKTNMQPVIVSELPSLLSSTMLPQAEVYSDAAELSVIYQDEVNIAIWRRQFDPLLQRAVAQLALASNFSSISAITNVDSVAELLQTRLPDGEGKANIIDDIIYLVDLFSCLFELPRVGFRLARLNRVMCPRFHVDAVPCRLVTTYVGMATEWIPNELVNREKLGMGNNGLPDHTSGVYQHCSNIQRARAGDVALLKGEKWMGNEGAGLVHRSPEANFSQGSTMNRLVMTLDFA